MPLHRNCELVLQVESKQLAQHVRLLLALEHNPLELADHFLTHSSARLTESLQQLTQCVQSAASAASSQARASPSASANAQATGAGGGAASDVESASTASGGLAREAAGAMALLEFISQLCDAVISNMSLTVILYRELFLAPNALAGAARADGLPAASLERQLSLSATISALGGEAAAAASETSAPADANYEELRPQLASKLHVFACAQLTDLFQLLHRRLRLEVRVLLVLVLCHLLCIFDSRVLLRSPDSAALQNERASDVQLQVRALDRLYRRLQALQKLLADELLASVPESDQQRTSSSSSSSRTTITQDVAR